MQFITAIIAAFAATASAAAIGERQAPLVCAGSTQPQCCAVSVLGLADLDCSTPPEPPTDRDSFMASCAATGLTAQCCTLPVLDQALICQDP